MASVVKVKKAKKSTKLEKVKLKKTSAGSNSEIFIKVQGIIAHQLKSHPNKITPESHLQNDLGADSLDALEVLNQVEDDFGVNVSEEEARKISTVQNIVDHLTKAIESKKKR